MNPENTSDSRHHVFNIDQPPPMSAADTSQFFLPHSQHHIPGGLPPQSHSPHNMPPMHSHNHGSHGHLIERPHSTPPGALRHAGMSHADIVQSDLSRGTRGLDYHQLLPSKLNHGSGNQTGMSTLDQMLATPNSRLAWRNANEELIMRGHHTSSHSTAPVGLATTIQASIQSLQQSVAGNGDDLDHSGMRKSGSKGCASASCLPLQTAFSVGQLQHLFKFVFSTPCSNT